MILIDGSFGEGGGQILRSSLALSLVTGQPFQINNIRSGRSRPGLMRQHLTAVRAAIEVGRARVEGAEIGSQQLTFTPQAIHAGNYHFAVGTAGSATLVLQTVLPALLVANGPSTLVLEGGTHNPYAPPFDFLEKAFVPIIQRMGPQVRVTLERPGFYPAGGGCFKVVVNPVPQLEPLQLLERGPLSHCRARAVLARLPRHIGERELKTLQQVLECDGLQVEIEEVADSRGPGNVLLIEMVHEHITEVFCGFGERRVSSEMVAKRAAKAVQRYQAAGVPVGHYLADQLLLPMAMAGGGRFRTVNPSRHTTTNIEVIKQFIPITIAVEERERDEVEIVLGR